jgi:hypothetical protein
MNLILISQNIGRVGGKACAPHSAGVEAGGGAGVGSGWGRLGTGRHSDGSTLEAARAGAGSGLGRSGAMRVAQGRVG